MGDSDEEPPFYEQPVEGLERYRELKLQFEETVCQVRGRGKAPYADKTKNGYVFRTLEHFRKETPWDTYIEFVRKKKKVIDLFVNIWSKDPDRKQYHGAYFAPPPSILPENALNLYVGTAVEEMEPVPDDALPEELLVHIGRLAGIPPGEPLDGDKRWEGLMDWLAHMFMCPGKLPRVMIILWSDKGGYGKTNFFDFIGDMLGGSESKRLYQASQKVDVVAGKFATAISNKLLVVLDDAKPSELQNRLDCLMTFVTVRSTDQEPKMQQAEHVRNFSRWMWGSNQAVLPMRNNENNRRIWVLECDRGLENEIDNDVYHTPLSNMMNDPKVQRAFYQYLMKRDVKNKQDWMASAPPSAMKEVWQRYADAMGPSVGGVTGGRLAVLQEPFRQFTIHLARTHDVYKKKLSRPKTGNRPSVMQDFEEFMEARYPDIWRTINKHKPYSNMNFGKEIKHADFYDVWPKATRYRRTSACMVYEVDVGKVRLILEKEAVRNKHRTQLAKLEVDVPYIEALIKAANNWDSEAQWDSIDELNEMWRELKNVELGTDVLESCGWYLSDDDDE